MVEVRADVMKGTFPGRIIESAVKGMLPKGPLGRAMYRKLKVYDGPEHQQAAQQPQSLTIKL
jgi:large subunit ribosomal protein L13